MLQDVTLAAVSQFQFGVNLDATIVGTFTNIGTVVQPSDVGTMQANISNNVTFTGTGAWTMSGSGNSVIRSITGGSTVLTNEAQHTIQGTGNLGSSNLGINNKGTIIANQATPLTVAPQHDRIHDEHRHAQGHFGRNAEFFQ